MKNQSLLRQSEAGFTLIELLVVIIMVGVLAAIAVPGWLGFMNIQKLRTAQNKASTLMHDAQVNAHREKIRWQVCFSDDGNQVLSSVGPSNDNCQLTNLETLIGQDSKTIKFTSTMSQGPNGYYRIQFNYDGSVVDGQQGKITFMPRTADNPKLCVTIGTLLGAIRSDKDACN